jgi:hypothetical protein
VTSRAGGEDLDAEVEREIRPSDINAMPGQKPHKPTTSSAPVKTARPNGTRSDHTPRGALAASDAPAEEAAIDGMPDAPSRDGVTEPAGQENGHGQGVDATVADGVSALPADNLKPSRSNPLKDSGRNPGDTTTDNSAAEQAADDPSPTVASSTLPSPAEPSAVSPAAFAWDMPDSPASPSSPPGNFLRSGANAKSPAAPDAPAAADSAKKTGSGETSAATLGTPKKGSSKRSARQAHLTVARVEPWSVMKFSFVVSLVAFVILFVAVSVLYGALAGLGVFDSLQRVVASLTSSQSSVGVNAAKWWSASRVLGYTALLGLLNIVLITAMSTIGAVVYNLTSRLVGGVEVTLRETE